MSLLIWSSNLGVGGDFHTLSFNLFIACVLVAHELNELHSGRVDYFYLEFGELCQFVFLLLEKIKRSSDLLVIEKWEAYTFPEHSCFGAVEEELFLEGIRILPVFKKVNTTFLRLEFCGDCCCFLDDFASIILSTIAAHSLVGQGLGCFCPKIVIAEDDYSAALVFGQLLNAGTRLGQEIRN